MTDFEQRIGPRGSPSPEPQPLYSHMTWTRPGYKTTPKKPRAQRQPSERTPHSSRSDGESTLLLRMHTPIPYPSKSRHTDPSPSNRRPSAKLPLSKRIAPETTGNRDTQTLALGNHRVEIPLGHGPATRRGSFLERDRTQGESSENRDTRTSNRRGGAMSVC